MDVALSFFRDGKYPDGFWRTSPPQTPNVGANAVLAAHYVPPGRNLGKVNTFTPDPHSTTLTTACTLYVNIVNDVVVPLYGPEPTGVLREALNRNLGYMYNFLPAGVQLKCPQLFPFGH